MGVAAGVCSAVRPFCLGLKPATCPVDRSRLQVLRSLPEADMRRPFRAQVSHSRYIRPRSRFRGRKRYSPDSSLLGYPSRRANSAGLFYMRRSPASCEIHVFVRRLTGSRRRTGTWPSAKRIGTFLRCIGVRRMRALPKPVMKQSVASFGTESWRTGQTAACKNMTQHRPRMRAEARRLPAGGHGTSVTSSLG